MFCSKTSNNTINKIHKAARRITLDNNMDSFVELLARFQDINLHRNIQVLRKKLFKVVNNLSSPIMDNF